MNGVKVGEVTDISVVGDPATLRFLSPVYIEIDPDKISLLGDERRISWEFWEKRNTRCTTSCWKKG